MSSENEFLSNPNKVVKVVNDNKEVNFVGNLQEGFKPIENEVVESDTITSEVKRLNFMIDNGYIDITDWGDEIAFKIMKEAFDLWKHKYCK